MSSVLVVQPRAHGAAPVPVGCTLCAQGFGCAAAAAQLGIPEAGRLRSRYWACQEAGGGLPRPPGLRLASRRAAEPSLLSVGAQPGTSAGVKGKVLGAGAAARGRCWCSSSRSLRLCRGWCV